MRFAFCALLSLNAAHAAVYPDVSKGRPPALLDARVGANLRLGDDSDLLPAMQRGQAEPHIVRSVANPEVLLATFQEGRFFDSGAVTCGYAISKDGGLTWRRDLVPQLTQLNGGSFNRATDPVAGAGPQGDLYLQNLASVQGAFQLAAVVLSRSTDGGDTWSPPIRIFESTSTLLFPDKNWLAVNDYSGVPNSGRLVATWTQFNRNAAGVTVSNPLVAAVSDDRGLTWTAPVNITPGGSSNQGTQPLFLPDGSLAVVYITFLNPTNVAQFSIHCKRSVDGGRTFPAEAATVVAFVNGYDDPVLRDGVFLPSATVARQSGEIFVTYVAFVGGTPRVLVTKSADRGATWTAPAAASNQPPGVAVMNPAIAATPDGRTLSVLFTDKRNAPDGLHFVDHYAALSFDGGASWAPNIRLSEMTSDVRFGPATQRGVMLGDYLGIAPSLAADQPCVAIWCETRTGDSDPWTVRFTPAPAANFQTWAIAHGISSDLGAEQDNDGSRNALEYAAGTNPRVRESGDDLVISRSGPTTFDVAWTERASVSFDREGLDRTDLAAAVEPDFERFFGATTLDLRPALLFGSTVVSPEQLPQVALPLGLVWIGRRLTLPTPAIRGVAVGRTMLVTGANPVVAGPMAALNTDARLVNLSTRGRTGPGADQMIVGFVIDGNKSILARAAGPALAAFGVSGALADPQLMLLAPAADFARSNDNWPQGGATAETFARLGAFPFPSNSLDAALLLQLGAQSYTAIVSGANNTSGTALVETYDADPQPGLSANPRLLNLSTRANTGDEALVAGFVISGSQPRRVLIRAVGPTLAEFGVSGPLADPLLTLFRGSTAIASNDDWEISRSSAAIAVTAQRVGAFALKPASLDAAVLTTLAPGSYTAMVTAVSGGRGIALVEIYDAD